MNSELERRELKNEFDALLTAEEETTQSGMSVVRENIDRIDLAQSRNMPVETIAKYLNQVFGVSLTTKRLNDCLYVLRKEEKKQTAKEIPNKPTPKPPRVRKVTEKVTNDKPICNIPNSTKDDIPKKKTPHEIAREYADKYRTDGY